MKEVESIYVATKEGRELQRIRNSFTFNFGIKVMSALKNPFRILILPYSLLEILKLRKKKIAFDFEPRTEYLVIGIDKTGEFFSTQAENIANRLQLGSNVEVTLVSTSQSGPKENNQIQWFRLPAARENNYTRKEWNITAERLISTTISLCKPRNVIFFGDYLYRGIIDSLEAVGENVEQYWLYSDYPESFHLDTSRYPRITKICIPSEMSLDLRQTAKKKIDFTKNSITFIVDVKTHSEIVLDILKKYPEAEIIGIQRSERLSALISSTINVSDLRSLNQPKNVYFVIDESSKIVPELSVVDVPGVLLLEGKVQSPILAEMISDLELFGDLIVARRFNPLDLEQTIEYMTNRKMNISLKSRNNDYVVKWMCSQGRGQNAESS